MKIRIHDEPFGRDGDRWISFSSCSCSAKNLKERITGLQIHFFKKLIYIDLERRCKDCQAPF